MPSIGFGVQSTGTLKESLGEIPDSYRAYFRSGFSRLAKLDSAKWPAVIAVTQASSPALADIELDQAARTLGLETEGISQLLSALRLLLGILAFRAEDISAFLGVASELRLVDKEDADRIKEFGNFAVRDKKALKEQLTRSSLQNELLPSLAQFQMKVDLRLEFEKEKLRNAVPIVLVHIDTDTSAEEIWFQMNPLQAEALAEKLQGILRQVKEAELAAKKLV